NHVVNVAVYIGNGAAEDVTAPNQTPDPGEAAHHVVSQIAGIFHARGAGHRRAKRPDDRHEAGKNDRLAAIAFIKFVCGFDVALLEKARIAATIKACAHAASDQVAELVAADGAEGDAGEQERETHMARTRKYACGDEQGIAGKEKADEEAGLDENDHADERRAAPFDQAADVVKLLKNAVNQVDHAP